MSLRIVLLGPPNISLDGEPVDLPGRRPLALLSYLLVTGRVHSRDHLVDLLFDGPNDPRAALRWTLSKLRQAIGSEYIVANRREVSFNYDREYWLDISAFEQGELELYQGDFLEGLYVRDAIRFEEWLTFEREQLRGQYQSGLEQRLVEQEHRSDGSGMVVTAHQLLQLDNLREDCHLALMEAYARLGRREAALAQYEQCRTVLAEELSVEPAAETTELYHQIREGKRSATGEPGHYVTRTRAVGSGNATKPTHNLPAELTPFFGREAELDELDQLLASDHVRLISIVGMGGMGKTRLALEASRRQIGNYRDGVFIVPLAPIDSPDNIPNAVADAIGFQFYSTDSPQRQLSNFLRQKQILLLLDNFEQLISGRAALTEILAAAAQVKILVTTRRQLRLQGETRLNIAGLDIEVWQNSEEARKSSVGQLFLQSAQRVQPEFTLDEENFQDVLTICRTMQGLPLGIELAAAWVDIFTLEEIINEISDEIGFLEVDFPDVPERHRKLRVVLEQSLRLLTETERDQFLRLCVFRGGFAREAAQQVAETDIRTLSTLVNKSLLYRDTEGRYTIHELLRRYGRSRLSSDINSYTGIQNAHADYYCSFLAELEDELNTGDAQMACREIERELGNVRIAWEWACQHGLFDHLVRAEYAIFLFREYQNRFQEMEQMYREAVPHLMAFEPSPWRDYVLSDVLRTQAWTALRFGQIERGLKLGLQSWSYLEDSKLPLKTGGGNDPRAPLTVLYTISGNYELARKTGEEMLKQHRDRGDRVKAILAYYSLSTLEMAEGNYERVRRYGRSAAKDFKATGHRYLYAYFLNNWGNAERELGDFDEAKRLFTESYGHMRDLGSTEGMTTALNNMAYIAMLQQEYDEARETFQQNIATYRDLGDTGGITKTLEGLGRIAFHQSDYPRAARLFSEALQTAGTALSALTLSILIRVSRLFLETNLREQACQILRPVMNHPASTAVLTERAREQLDEHGLDLKGRERIVTLEDLVDQTIRWLDEYV